MWKNEKFSLIHWKIFREINSLVLVTSLVKRYFHESYAKTENFRNFHTVSTQQHVHTYVFTCLYVHVCSILTDLFEIFYKLAKCSVWFNEYLKSKFMNAWHLFLIPGGLDELFWCAHIRRLTNLIHLNLNLITTDEILLLLGNHCQKLQVVNIVSR